MQNLSGGTRFKCYPGPFSSVSYKKDLQKLDSLIHHLRSSWEVLRADQPLNVLYGLLRGDALPDGEALSHAVTAVLDKGVEIIRLAEEERRKYEDE